MKKPERSAATNNPQQNRGRDVVSAARSRVSILLKGDELVDPVDIGSNLPLFFRCEFVFVDNDRNDVAGHSLDAGGIGVSERRLDAGNRER